jgi:hypothetical protein
MSSCAVCFDIASGKCVALSECGHVFHPSCITKWFDIKKKSSRDGFSIPTAPCVVCRVAFDISAAIPVYLDVPSSALKATVSARKATGTTTTRVDTLTKKRKKKKKTKFEKKETVLKRKAEEDAFEDVVVLVSDTSDGEESEDGIVAEDVDEEQCELENENAELRRLLFEEKRKTREAEDAVVLSRCNNDAFAQSKMQLESLHAEYMQVQEESRVAKAREKIAVDKAKAFESRVAKAESDVKTLRSEIVALKHQRKVEMDVFSDNDAVNSSRFFEEEQIARLMDQKDKRMALESLARSLRMKSKCFVALQDEYNKVIKRGRFAEKSLRDLEMKYAKRKAREKQSREELRNLMLQSEVAENTSKRKRDIKESNDISGGDEDDDDNVDDDDDLLIIEDDGESKSVFRDASNSKRRNATLTRASGNVKGSFKRNNNENGGSFIRNGDDGRGGRTTILKISSGELYERKPSCINNKARPASRSGMMMQKNISTFVQKRH